MKKRATSLILALALLVCAAAPAAAGEETSVLDYIVTSSEPLYTETFDKSETAYVFAEKTTACAAQGVDELVVILAKGGAEENGQTAIALSRGESFMIPIGSTYTRIDVVVGGETVAHIYARSEEGASEPTETENPTETAGPTESGNSTVSPTSEPSGEPTDEPTDEPTAEPTAPSFTDVPDYMYYAEPVAWAVANGITNGTTATTFSPDDDCTVAQIITLIWRALGSPESTAACQLENVPADSAYYAALCWAGESGIIGEETSGAYDGCTRAMAVSYLHRALDGGKPRAQAGFGDVPAGAYYADAVAWALESGITTGTTATEFSPDRVCNRGQIVTFLYRAAAE